MKFRNKVKFGVQLFIFISIITLVILFVFTGTKETWYDLLHSRWELIILTFVLWGIYVLLDAWKISLLAKAMGHRLSIWKSAQIILTGLFLAAVTPFQTGGFPVQIYIMYKENIPPGKSMLILFMRGIFAFIVMAGAMPFVYLRYADAFNHVAIKTILFYLMIVYVGIITLLLFVSLFPKKGREISRKLVSILPMKLRKKIIKSIDNFFDEMEIFKATLKDLIKNEKMALFAMILITIASFIAYFSMAPVILWSLRVDSPYVLPLLLQFLIVFMTFFSPTPGASGVSEGTFAIFYKALCPKHLLGIYTFLWRFFIFYLGSIVGGILLMRMVHREGKDTDKFLEEAEEFAHNEEIDE